MFEHIPIEAQARHAAAEAQKTATQAERNAANIDYIAMMSNIDIDPEEEDEVTINE
jgi:hypothetical protein